MSPAIAVSKKEREGARSGGHPFDLILRVGFSGHRDMTPAVSEQLHDAIVEILQRVQRRAKEFATDHPQIFLPDPQVQFLSGLAAGADQSAARGALDSGCKLVPISPFRWEEFLADFATTDAAAKDDVERARDEALDLWERGAGHQIEMIADLERGKPPMNGVLVDPEHAAALGAMYSEGNQGYVAQGRFILQHADLMVVFLDPAHAHGGEGGTRWVMREARGLSVPVVGMQPRGADIEFEGTKLEESLARILQAPRTLRAPKDNENESKQDEQRVRSTYLVDDYLPESIPAERNSFSRWFSDRYGHVLKRLGGSLDGSPSWTAGSPDQERADELAKYYNGLHRTTFTTMYVLAFLAVLAAVLGHLVYTLTKDVHSENALVTFLTHYSFATLELVFLGGIAVLYRTSRRHRWRDKGTDYRLLGELLRIGHHLLDMRHNLRMPLPAPQGTDGDVANTWMAWYAKLLIRPGSLESAAFDQGRNVEITKQLSSSWLEGQRSYHDQNAHRCKNVEKLIRRSSNLLFVLAVVGCLSHLPPCSSFLPLGGWALILTAALPALLASLHGIASQGELARLELRSSQMRRWLEERTHELTELQGVTPLRRDQIVDSADRIAIGMIREVAEWRWLHAVHDPKLT